MGLFRSSRRRRQAKPTGTGSASRASGRPNARRGSARGGTVSPELVRKYSQAAPESPAQLRGRRAEADQIEERLRNDRGLSMSSASILTASEVRQGYK